MIELNENIQFLVHPDEKNIPSDFSDFAHLVRHHRYYHALEDFFNLPSTPLDTLIKADLKNDYTRQLQNQLLIASELQKVCTVLNRRKLFYLNLKGTTLALQLYGKISDRLTRDIDFLIREKDIDLFMDVFYKMGYQLIGSEKNRPEKTFRKIKKNYTLIHSETRLIIELHWGLFSNPWFYTHQHSFFENPDTTKLNGTLITTLNRENNFLYLCMHGIYHEFFRLFWLRDIAEILKKWDLNWNEIKNRAKTEGIDRIIASAALLAGEVFKFETPFEEYSKDRNIRWIVNHNIKVINRSSLPEPSDRLKRIKYFMKLRRESRYKMECVIGIAKRYWIRK